MCIRDSNYQIANNGSLTKGQYLASNNYVRWSNLYGADDIAFKFWSLRGRVNSFKESSILNNTQTDAATKYIFDKNQRLRRQEVFNNKRITTEIVFDNFQNTNNQTITIKRFDSTKNLINTESQELHFNKLFKVCLLYTS